MPMAIDRNAASLTAEERRCLEYLSYHPGVDVSYFGQNLLEKLQARGLIEPVTHLAIPVLPQQRGYQLTTKGRSLVNQSE